MIALTKYQKQLDQLIKKKDSLNVYYREKLRNLHDAVGATQEDIVELTSEARFEVDQVMDSIDELRTRKMMDKAKRRFLPIPPTTDEKMWRESNYGDGWLLTNEGLWNLKMLLREETKWWREFFITIVSLSLALIGTITGLISV